ncbi:MAG: STAS domain-containing protein [Cytophagales bacterium]|jgi:anti-sigma B factor antagonist|nr:STAS domain-containing protein [Cytophagales bacterium]MCA6388993.1 STAS domain-containing protein [Cytophagales bacterium]MCA6393475.1 STAS domain-containing protein [Cytophagales bacterium]MCA6395429.1 STAS domain-containing protein [Cytophagales bacterium]MCA6399495.1 STAS domain-containing protein [Cytophagales bacterium]
MVHIKRLQEEGADIIVIIGEIDASSSIELDLAIAKSVGDGYRKILVDCNGLEYISSAGLGVFMSYIEELKDKKVYLVLFGLKERVLNTFSILGLADLLNIRETKSDAKKLADELSV